MGKKKEKAVNVTCFTLNKIENMDTLHKINKIVNTNAHSKSYYTKMPKTYGLNSFLFTKKLHPRLSINHQTLQSRPLNFPQHSETQHRQGGTTQTTEAADCDYRTVCLPAPLRGSPTQ